MLFQVLLTSVGETFCDVRNMKLRESLKIVKACKET